MQPIWVAEYRVAASRCRGWRAAGVCVVGNARVPPVWMDGNGDGVCVCVCEGVWWYDLCVCVCVCVCVVGGWRMLR